MDNTKMVSSLIKSPSRYYAGMLVGLGNRQVNYRDMECTRIGCFNAGLFIVRWPMSDRSDKKCRCH